jgi:hypothetical protein
METAVVMEQNITGMAMKMAFGILESFFLIGDWMAWMVPETLVKEMEYGTVKLLQI